MEICRDYFEAQWVPQLSPQIENVKNVHIS